MSKVGFVLDDVLEKFPELKESEDEKIRKELIRAFNSLNTLETWNGIKRTDILTWLEKQGEQKPADKVKPKFKVGDFVRSKHNKAVILEIEEVCNDIYKTEGGGYIRIEFQDDWELIELKSAWSEEDEIKLTTAKTFIRNTSLIGNDGIKEATIDWVNDLKNRVQCKPSY